MHTAIELHDSGVEAVRQEEGAVKCYFASAYLHKSDGKPGIDAGTGWSQRAELTIEHANWTGTLPEFPSVILDGSISVDGVDQNGMIPIPLSECSETELVLKFDTVNAVHISGKWSLIVLKGDPKFIEHFPSLKSENP